MAVADVGGNSVGLIWDDFSANLSRFLDLTDSSDIIEYLISIGNENDVEEYLCGLLDKSNPDHCKFISTFMSKWKTGGMHIPVSVRENVHIYQKADYKEATGSCRRSEEKGVSSELCKLDQSVESPEAGKGSSSKAGKKQKFVPLYSEEGRAKSIIQFPGRHRCNCQAAKHNLINNCLSCGRIVCEQEGSGPCLFCGKLVCRNEEQEIIDRNSKTSCQLYKKLMGGSGAQFGEVPLTENKGFHLAVDHKNKLLEYDRTVERRTRVIDDQSDYFTTDNRWLSKEERDAVKRREEEIDARKKASQKTTKVTFDFAGRQVVEEKENFDHKTEEEIQADIQKFINRSSSDNSDGINPMAADLPRPVYVSHALPAAKHHRTTPLEDKNKSRLQDRELQEMSDEGWALSLHQPYASLLIAGLKMHEGRVWYSALRGRLWIASTAREPEKAEIQQIENSVRISSGEDNVIFPSLYPVGALLGCVDMVDCLPQEEYRKKYPDGESEELYVFICENPQELIVKFPVRGKHKIYKLDSRIHDAAKKTIKRSPVQLMLK